MHVTSAKQMADALIAKEYRGQGDTYEGAYYRLQSKWGLSISFIKRLVYDPELKDFMASNYVALQCAYHAACVRTERQIEHERATHEINPIALKAADFVVRTEKEEG
ncbi:hypothetical protein [Lentilitoribacter sp. Alg239-R112]|uniref:hypothetical protein n=1 Tax=Lentilitoribacter sp. Alg239-R112 TaxID=2305987 RepID=UPI0013A68A25|nr:hypothetical protein [Lentilitoribacter sp. Alg239-R112]